MRADFARGRRFRTFYWLGYAAIFLLALALSGCGLLRVSSRPRNVRVTSAQLTNSLGGVVTSAMLQEQVMRFADTYVAMISQGCDDVASETTNTDVRVAALRWKLGQATAAYSDATGENPSANALDLLVLATISRSVVQDSAGQMFGTNTIQPLLRAHITMESNAWTMASGILSPSQQAELRDLIRQWRQKFPHQRNVGVIRFREFAAALGQSPQPATTRSASIFSLLYLNPLAGLDPTTAAIEGMRQLGERTMYYTQRMPNLLNWQMQLLAYELAAQPASTQLMDNLNQFASTAAVISKTSKQLPQVINEQRQAAIQQILNGLIGRENRSSQLLTNTRVTLDSASIAASNINTAILSLRAFVQLVTPTNSSPPAGTSGTPFNVLDYGKAASQIGVVATNVNAMLITANQTLPQIKKLSAQMTDDADHLVHHAFVLGLVLILVLLAGAVVAGLVYRALANRLSGGNKTSK